MSHASPEPPPADWILSAGVSPAQGAFLDAVQALGRDFVAGDARDGKVLRYADNATLRRLFSEPLPQTGCSLDDLLDVLRDKVVAHSVAQHDPRYLAFPDVGSSLAGVAADILNAFLNQNLIAVDRSAPAGSFVEAQLILWLRELVGFPSCALADLPSLEALGGMWTPGGNLSNYVAVLTALHHRHPTARRDGLVGLGKRPVIVQAREIAHFSYAGAAAALGLGEQGMLWSPASADFTTDPEALARTLGDRPDDVEPFMVVAVAGNCRTTSIDDLAAIRRVCDEHGLWMHVDACHGGSLLFSPTLRAARLAGIELADSVSLDPHKGMFVTYPASYVLIREPQLLAQTSRYPDKVRDPECLDLGLITPFLGSRGFHSLKLWLLIKHLGVDGLAHAVESRHAANLSLVAALEATGLFVTLNDQVFYRVAFVFCPEPVRARIVATATADPDSAPRLRALVSAHTIAFCEALYRSGQVAFDLASTHDLGDAIGLGAGAKYTVMGMVVGQPTVTQAQVDGILGHLRAEGARQAEAMLAAIDRRDADAPPARSGPAGW